MLAAATSLFARTNIHQNYNIGTPAQSSSRPATPGTNSSSLNAPAPPTPTFHVGLWKVQSAWHKVTNKRVSVWVFDKRGPEMERLGPQGKDRVLEVLKSEASALTRLRHPSVLEMVEPLEETRNEVMFATEPALSSLALAIPDSGRRSSLVELDEVEIQKGILQLCKGLSFIHNSAKLIHSNICPESIIINGSGDWKIAGLGLTIALQAPGGGAARWEFPTFDARVPDYVQRSFDYMAPEYALDEQLVVESDMYSLGCVVYAVHCKGNPPFKNHGSLSSLRDNATKSIPGLTGLDPDLQVLLKALITRHYGNRPTPDAMPSYSFFSSLSISTLNFLDRSNFTTKTREEKISFMKGLGTVLDRFSDGLKTRKILPSLLEEMKDTHLLPYILPNVFSISSTLSPSQFAATVLPSLKPLFAIREPPQNMLTLLDNLTMLQSKTEKNVFREHVLPLVYNALDSEHAIVQERALKAVPELCESIDYAEVQGVLFPRVALVFTKTRILSVKVGTLVTFLAMVKTLDQMSLTQKLVPLLAKIKTKEPAVMMATLQVQEAMGFKVDREAVATLVLPQLWTMSMGPLLSVGQFQRFMEVIKKLGDRVEKEHLQFLRDSQRIEDRSALNNNGEAAAVAKNVDFESLVGRAGGVMGSGAATVKSDTTGDGKASWDDDVWGSIFNDTGASSTSSPPPVAAARVQSPPSTTSLQTSRTSFQSRTSASKLSFSGTPLGQNRTVNLSTAPISAPQASPVPPVIPGPPTLGQRTQQQSQPSFPSFTQPSSTPSFNSVSMAPSKPASQFPAPNYNLYSTSTNAPLPSFGSMSSVPPQPPSMFGAPPSMGNILTPSKPATSPGNQKNFSNDAWNDFDPLA